MKKFDALIIGGGPAGSSCAIGLAQQGLKVVVVDKSLFPRPKVCGGFIGPQSREVLSTFGVWQKLIDKGAQRIDRSKLVSPNGESVTIPIYEGQALGCSRNLLDAVLLDRVKEMGVEVLEGAQVRQIFNNGNGFELDIDHYRKNQQHRFYATHLIDASGHPSPPDKSRHVQMGIAALYEDMPSARGQVMLYCCPKGHVGINPFEGNRVNVCYVVQADLFQEKDCDPQKVLDGWMKDNHGLRETFEGIKRLTPWKAVYVPVRKAINLLDKGIWHAGDSAGFINPVTGGGMSIALISGQLLAQSIVKYDNDQERLKAYTKSYKQCFFGQRWLASLWGELAHRPWSAKAVIKLLNSHDYFKNVSMQQSHPRISMELI